MGTKTLALLLLTILSVSFTLTGCGEDAKTAKADLDKARAQLKNVQA